MFLRTERSVQQFFDRYPIVSIIIILNIVFWLLTNVLPLQTGKLLYLYGVGHNRSITDFGEYWRLVTPVFLHANIGHLLFNSFALVLFGPALEKMIGRAKFIFSYLLLGVLGNIGTLIISPMSDTLHLGASGAIYGLLGIYIFMTFARKDLIDPQSAQIVRTIFVIGLVLTFIQPNINIPAHLFGFIAGVAIALPLLKQAKSFYLP